MTSLIGKKPGEHTLVRSIFGSHLYGLHTATSDKDFKEVFVPSISSILLHGPNQNQNITTKLVEHTKNTSEDIDDERFSLGTFIKHLCDGEMIAIDLLHSEPIHWISYDEPWTWIIGYRKEFYTKNMRAYVGYIRKQVSKYGIKGFRLAVIENVLGILNAEKDKEAKLVTIWDKLPVDNEYTFKKKSEGPNYQNIDFYEILGKSHAAGTKIKDLQRALQGYYDNYGVRAKKAAANEGIDWKAVSHAFRACYQLITIYERGGFNYPLDNTPTILQIKLGELSYKQKVEPMLEELYGRVLELGENSKYPVSVNQAFRDNLQLEIYDYYYGYHRRSR